MERQVFNDARIRSLLPSKPDLASGFEAIDLSMVKSKCSPLHVSKTEPAIKVEPSESNTDPIDILYSSEQTMSTEQSSPLGLGVQKLPEIDNTHESSDERHSVTVLPSVSATYSSHDSSSQDSSSEDSSNCDCESQRRIGAPGFPTFESVFIKEEPSSPCGTPPNTNTLAEAREDSEEEPTDDPSELLESKIEPCSPSPPPHTSAPIAVHLINAPDKCASLLPQDANIEDDVGDSPSSRTFKICAQEYPINLTGEKPYICGVCGKTFVTNQNLQCHFRTHTGERPFKCDTCQKTFLENRHYKLHLNTHTGVRPFKCSTCDKSFIYNSNLQCHMKLHTGIKPFKCPACGNAYITNQNLQRHLRSHSGIRPFECSTCGKTFTEDRHLQRHLKSHTGIRPFKCPTCGKSFIENHDLQRHIRIHTEGRPSKAKS